ncbi:MAG: SH3 domain-containing protein [Anaerolineae bacterium]|nr:SH3 domain-containing protein [Anaerolineae bacterium]
MILRSYRRPPHRRGGGPPAWVVVVVVIALVMGAFYLWDGMQRFLRSGGLGVAESTQRAEVIETATAERIEARVIITRTALPTGTPLPQCQDFRVEVVDAPNALVREAPNLSGAIIDAFPSGTIVCVLWREPDGEFYAIDANIETRRHEIAFMHESVLVPLNPTATPSATATAPPTITAIPVDETTENGAITQTPDSAQPTMPPSAG